MHDMTRKWLAENVLRGITDEALIQPLIGQGFTREAIIQELAAIRAHPYTNACRVFVDQMRRQQWVMNNVERYTRSQKPYSAMAQYSSVPRKKDFLEQHFFNNEPCVFKAGVKHWKACKQWTLDHVEAKVGRDARVQIQKGRAQDADYEIKIDQQKTTMPFGEFLDTLRQFEKHGESSNDIYMTASNSEANHASVKPLYQDFGQLGSDYLDLRPDVVAHTRLWIGPKGSMTHYHFDTVNVLCVQALGAKKFTLVPSLQMPLMYNEKSYFSLVDVNQPDTVRLPDYNKATAFEAVLKPGDAIFIPFGWWHAVEGLETSISLSMFHFDVPSAPTIETFPNPTVM